MGQPHSTKRPFAWRNQYTDFAASPEDRFWSHVYFPPCLDDCWRWTASSNAEGYGRFALNGKLVAAHRYSYALSRGPIPNGLVIDHLCRNPACVNPSHLEVVTFEAATGVAGPGEARA